MRIDFFLVFIQILIFPILVILLFKIRVKRLIEIESPISGKLIVEQHGLREKHLLMNWITQGISPFRKKMKNTYWGKVAHLILEHCAQKKSSQILIIGLGANTISKMVNQANSAINQTIVEIDPKIIELCNKYFGLKQMTNTKVIDADIFQLIQKPDAFPHKFDCIVTDLFTGKDSFFTVNKQTPQFLMTMKSILKDDGIIIFNRPAHTPETQVQTEELIKVLEGYFTNITKEYVFDKYHKFYNDIVTARI